MQIILEHAAALYDDMEKNIKLFKRDSYEDTFAEYYNKNRALFDRVTAILREYENEEDTAALEEIAGAVVGAAGACLDAVPNRIGKENAQINLNMITVIYVLPTICGIKEKRAEELAETVCKQWKAAFRGNNIKASDFKTIQSGFKTKLCYVTTAVCRSLRKPENCYELTTLKRYRDEYLANAEGGSELIHAYYDIAPTIVKRIEKEADAEAKYRYLWETYLKPCISLIEAGQNEACKELYVEMVEKLHGEYGTKR